MPPVSGELIVQPSQVRRALTIGPSEFVLSLATRLVVVMTNSSQGCRRDLPPAVPTSAPGEAATPSLPKGPAPKRINHPIVGEMTLSFETLMLASSGGIMAATYLAEPGTRSANDLDLLHSRSARPLPPTSAT